MYTENRARSASVMLRMCSLRPDRALSKLNLLFHSNSKRNRVTEKMCNSHHLQYYYKIELLSGKKFHEPRHFARSPSYKLDIRRAF